MTTRIAALCLLLFASVAGAGLILARDTGDHPEVSTQKLIEQALTGEDGKEVVAQTYVFPPGVVLPWHIHPDAHEIAYVLEGDFTFEREGAPPRPMKAGEADYLAPNIVHRGMNTSDQPVRLFVVRIKPKDKPLVQEVPPPQ
jgi:quercetin dioxygenase-like cupin family protein